tara:strand:- start:294 stop:620 length:327 start_codon:yes stop_codon:yes gene_type:complete
MIESHRPPSTKIIESHSRDREVRVKYAKEREREEMIFTSRGAFSQAPPQITLSQPTIVRKERLARWCKVVFRFLLLVWVLPGRREIKYSSMSFSKWKFINSWNTIATT